MNFSYVYFSTVSPLRYLAVEHTEEQVRKAIESLLSPRNDGRPALIVQIPNLANLPIYRITPDGRDMIKRQKGMAGKANQAQGPL